MDEETDWSKLKSSPRGLFLQSQIFN